MRNPQRDAIKNFAPSQFGDLLVLTMGTSRMLGEGPVNLLENRIVLWVGPLELCRQKVALLGCEILRQRRSSLKSRGLIDTPP